MRWTPHATSMTLVALASAAVVAVAVDARRPSAEEEASRRGKLLPAFRREALQRIACTGGDGSFTLERRADAFHLAELGEEADPAPVDRLLGALENGSLLRRADQAGGEALGAPRIACTLSLEGASSRLVVYGDAPPPRGGVYVRVDEGDAVVIAGQLAAELSRSGDTYRRRELVGEAFASPTRLVVEGRDGRIELTRLEGDAYRLPSGVRAARGPTDALLAGLAHLTAERFLRPAEADAVPMEAPVTVTAETAAGAALRITFGGRCPGEAGTVARRQAPSPVAACVAGAFLELVPFGRSLEDDRLFFARLDEVEEIRWETPGARALELARKESGWRLRSPREEDLDAAAADAATATVAALARAAGALLPPPGAAPAPSVKATVTLHRAGAGDERVELVELPATPAALVARRAADGRLLSLRPEVARLLLPRPSSLAPRALFAASLEKEPVAGLELLCGGRRQRVERRREGFVLTEPSGYRADAATTLDIAGAVLRARVDAWLEPAEVPPDAFRTACSLRVELEGDAGPPMALTLGRDEGDALYARREADGAVGLAPRALRTLASRLLVDRHGFSVEKPRLERVTLERGRRRVVLLREGEVLRIVEGPEAVSAAELADALETLRADEVVHLGSPRPDEGFSAPRLRVNIELVGGGTLRYELGAADVIRDARIVYGRVLGVDAVFALARERVEPLLRAFGEP